LCTVDGSQKTSAFIRIIGGKKRFVNRVRGGISAFWQKRKNRRKHLQKKHRNSRRLPLCRKRLW
jgi:hypothetical protein